MLGFESTDRVTWHRDVGRNGRQELAVWSSELERTVPVVVDTIAILVARAVVPTT
jgi:hypothetical protein